MMRIGLVAFAVLVMAATACSPTTETTDDTVGDPGESAETTIDASGSSTTSTTVTGSEAVPTTPWPELPLTLTEIAQVDAPIDLVGRAGTDDLYVAERAGRVRLLSAAESGSETVPGFVLDDDPVLDISDQVSVDGEQGLLGIEFSADGRMMFVSYTDRSGRSVLAEYPMDGTGVATERGRVLMTVDQPYRNHNGGQVRLGPDGLLYWGLGDGGGSGDPDGNGQNTNTLLGSLLRIDPVPTDGQQYAIPSDNPFRSGGGAPEIFAYGLRNPWRFSFDLDTGSLWVADVGQDAIEEINFVSSAAGGGLGANFGWSAMEGDEEFSGPAPEAAVGPLLSLRHGNGNCAVIGGYVYRGDTIVELDGVYVFADFCTGQLTGIEATVGGPVVADLAVELLPTQLWSFGQDTYGELYVLGSDGLVAKLTPPASGGTSDL